MRLVKKSESRLMRAIGWTLTPITPHFMGGFWTTLGSTIYVPTRYDLDPDWGTEAWVRRHRDVIDHELVHVAQFDRWGWVVMIFLYLGPTPLPVLLSWGRWRIEREAYLINLRRGRSPESISHTIWRHYGWPWPRAWMIRWLNAHRQG